MWDTRCAPLTADQILTISQLEAGKTLVGRAWSQTQTKDRQQERKGL